MRILKVLGLAIAGVFALVVVALLAAWLLIDPNDYKDRIAASVRASTGRELSMPGVIKLSIFPWLALEVGPASLGNPTGFGAEPFATVQRAALRVRLLPLLSGELQIGRVEIDGLDLRLKKNREGKGNWEDFGGDESAPTAAASGSGKPLELAGVTIKDSRIAFDDLVAEQVALDIGRVAPGATIPFKAGLRLTTSTGAQPIVIAGGFGLTTQGDAWRLNKLALEGTLMPKAGSAAVAWKFAAPVVAVDLKKQTLDRTSFEAALGAAQLAGNLEGSSIVDAPDLRGDFTLQQVPLRELLKQLGIAAPVTRDAGVLARLAASGGFRYADDAAAATGLAVQLDDSALAGAASLNTKSGAMAFDLSLDRIDLDRYLSPPATGPAAGRKEPFVLPADALKGLKAKGTFAIGDLKVAGVTLTKLQMGIDAAGDVAHLAPLKAQLYGGQYSGDIVIDARAEVPVLKLDQSMTGIDVAKLLTALADTRRLSGRGNVTTALTAKGRDSDALTRTLRGKLNLNLADGAVEGLDLWYAISQATSLLGKQQLAGGSNTGKTAFETFRVSADVVDGVATTDDLNIVSQQLRVTGKGSSNLVTQAIDYQVTATVLKSADRTLAAIPVNVTGTFDNPKVRPDVEGLAKARVKQELDKHKGELEEKLRDKLKGLFGR